MIEGIQKPFPPGESTFAGRTQALLDSIFGVDKIGLDPGEKPSKSQPSEADISFIDSLIMVPGTTKVTKLTPKLRAELLKKRLEKGDLTPSQTKKLGEIVDIRKLGTNPDLDQQLTDTAAKQLRKELKTDSLGDLSDKQLQAEFDKLIPRRGKPKSQMTLVEQRQLKVDKRKREILGSLLGSRKSKKPTDLDVIKGKTRDKKIDEAFERQQKKIDKTKESTDRKKRSKGQARQENLDNWKAVMDSIDFKTMRKMDDKLIKKFGSLGGEGSQYKNIYNALEKVTKKKITLELIKKAREALRKNQIQLVED